MEAATVSVAVVLLPCTCVLYESFVENSWCYLCPLRRYSPVFCRDGCFGCYFSGWHVYALRRRQCDADVSGLGPKTCPNTPCKTPRSALGS